MLIFSPCSYSNEMLKLLSDMTTSLHIRAYHRLICTLSVVLFSSILGCLTQCDFQILERGEEFTTSIICVTKIAIFSIRLPSFLNFYCAFCGFRFTERDNFHRATLILLLSHSKLYDIYRFFNMAICYMLGKQSLYVLCVQHH